MTSKWIVTLDTWLLMLAAGLIGGAGLASALRKYADPFFDMGIISVVTLVVLGTLAFFLAADSVRQARGRTGWKLGLSVRAVWLMLLVWACWFQPEPWFRFREPLQVQETFEKEYQRQRVDQVILFVLFAAPYVVLAMSRIRSAHVRQQSEDRPGTSARESWALAVAGLALSAATRAVTPEQQGLGVSTVALLIGEAVILFELARRSRGAKIANTIAALGVIVVGTPLACFWP
jgi:hypothetical protein